MAGRSILSQLFRQSAGYIQEIQVSLAVNKAYESDQRFELIGFQEVHAVLWVLAVFVFHFYLIN